MHFLISALGSYGDVHPMIGLGKALADRGHEVGILANPYFEDPIAAAGLELVPLGTRQEYLDLVYHPDLWHPTRGPFFVLGLSCGQFLRPLFEVVRDNLVPGETVLCAHGLDVASRIAGEKFDVPVASVNFAPTMFISKYQSARLPQGLWSERVPPWIKGLQYWLGDRLIIDPKLAPPINAFRRELGLPAVRHVYTRWWHDTDAVLGMFPDWFAPPQPDWPAGTTLTGFPLWDHAEGETLPEEVDDFLSNYEAPFVFTPGSANASAELFFTAAVDACTELSRPGILLTKFPEQLPAELPPHVRHFEFVPLSLVLPRAAAFIHHGGIGSCAQGLAAGVRQVVRPLSFDQFDNSIRLQRLGVGREISVRRFRGPALIQVLNESVDSKDVASRCQQYAALCDGGVALAASCQLLETLATPVGAR